MDYNPIDGFQVDPADIKFIGKDLQRPECILAKRTGDLWAADARGGVVKINGANVTQADVDKIDPNAPGTSIGTGIGQAPSLATQYSPSTVGTTAQATQPGPMQASTMTASMSQQGISDAMQAVNPAQGALSRQAIANAARMDPSQTQVGNLQAAQGQAILMNNPVPYSKTKKLKKNY